MVAILIRKAGKTMNKPVEIKPKVWWTGSLDPDLRIFDIVMRTEFGTSYNSYIVSGNTKTALIEVTKENFWDSYLQTIGKVVDPAAIDYIILNHTEPDHSGALVRLLELAPQAQVVGSRTAIMFLRNIVNHDFSQVIVNEGDTLDLGGKTLQFISAPYLHWPDSIYTYLVEDQILFTCDSFGCHYANSKIFNDLLPDPDGYWTALRYYFEGIIAPFKPYVLEAIKKIDQLDYKMICPGHGPVLREHPHRVVELYRQWAGEARPAGDEQRVVIAYVSAYGYTRQLAEQIAAGIRGVGNIQVDLYDLVEADRAAVIKQIYWADGLLFGSPTINRDALEPIWEVLVNLNPVIHGKKTAAAFGAFGWSGEAVGNIEARLKQLHMKLITPGLKVNFRPTPDDIEKAYEFGRNFARSLLGITNEPAEKPAALTKNVKVKPETAKPVTPQPIKYWKCVVCGQVFAGAEPPVSCPACGAGQEQFIEVAAEPAIVTADTDRQFVILGNGIAGLTAAEEIRKRDRTCKITLVGAEEMLTYYRPMLSDYLSVGLANEDLLIHHERWYAEQQIELILGVMAERIDADTKQVYFEDGRQLGYDKLIITTGAYNFIPELPGIDKQGLYTLRTINDAKWIITAEKYADRAVIIGGGLLGLEAAWELRNRGLEVAIVETAPRLLPRQLDEEGSALFSARVAAAGIKVYLNAAIAEITGGTAATGVKLKSEEIIAGDLILFSVGVRPNKEVAEAAGVAVDKGIIVDNHMQTNLSDVYAAGDVAEFAGTLLGIWPNALEQGKIAGANAAGEIKSYSKIVPANTFTGMNTNLYSIGNLGTNSGVEYQTLRYENRIKGIYRKLYFIDHKLVGGILLGDIGKAGALQTAVAEERMVNQCGELLS